MSGSDKVMPPKKSKAARKTEVLPDETPDAESTEVQEQNGHADDLGKGSDAASGSGQEHETPVNIFQQQIVEGKRKRNAPLAEQTLHDWLKKNFVEKENSFLVLNDMYQSYLEACSSIAAFAMDYTNFHKAVTQMFPRGQSLMEDSPYKDTIRERKPKKKSTTKIQADSLHLKMKDIIKEAITDLGNPRKGIGFSAIKNLVAGKFPALRVDLRVNILKNAIFRELRFGHIECVRGIGACGYYRLPRTAEQEAEEVEAEKKEAQEKALKKKGKKDATSSEEKTDENAEKTGDDSENAEKKDEEKPVESEETATEKPAKKKKTKKRKKPQKDYYVTHSEPQHIEDTFALAMTYNSEPKEASVAKIRKYIKDFYKEDISIEKLKKCLDTGVEHGFWFQVTGHGSGSGSFRLTINEFDPLADDDLTGRVMNAIVACTEPKQSSALLLKKYVQDYHPNFRVAERPHLFKLSLQRAVNKNKIVQLSGIGATGTFQLVDPFLPSPTVLQGKDSTSDYGESDVEVIEDVEAFQDAYKPRPTKRRGMGRSSATGVRRLDASAATHVPPQTGSRAPKSRGVKKAAAGRGGRNAGKRNAPSLDDESEDEESEEELPKKKAASPVKRKAPGRPAAGKAKKPKVVAPTPKKPAAKKVAASAASKTVVESESEEYDSEPEAYTPRRSTSRGGSSAPSAAAQKTGRGGKAKTAPSPVHKAPAPAKGKKRGGKDESDEEDEDSEVEKPPVTPSRKGKPAGKGARKGKKGKAPVKKTPARGVAKEQSESEEEPAALPVTPKSGTQSGRRLGSAARMRAQPPSEDDDEKKESSSSKLTKSSGLKVTVVLTSPKRGSAGSGKQVHKVTNISPVVNAKTSEDEEEEDEKQEQAKKPKFGKSAVAGRKKKGGKKAKSRK